jgi:hypothetical protein
MIEFLLSIFYFIIICFIIGKIPFFKDSKIPTHWFISIFGIKVITSIILTLIYTKYYNDRDTADIFKYFDDSLIMFEAIKTNPLDYFKMLIGIDTDYTYFTVNYYQFMNHWTRPYSTDLISDSHIIIRLNAFFRIFSFGYFQVHNILINFISLFGLTLIFKAFKPYLFQKEKAFFYILFLAPSILFWGSGLLKESVIFFALGLLIYSLFKITKQFSLITASLIIISVLLITFTKLYILVSLSIPILGYLINLYLKLKKPLLGYFISISLFLILINIAPLINSQFDFIFQISNKQQTFSRFVTEVQTNSSFLIPELTDGFSLLKSIPNALNNTLIRPFLWECKSPFVWLSAFENIVIIILIVISISYRKTMDSSEKNIFLFSLIFALYLFTIIGLTTPVFGAIMRYKVPGLILMLISLLLFVDLEKIKLKHPILKKIL